MNCGHQSIGSTAWRSRPKTSSTKEIRRWSRCGAVGHDRKRRRMRIDEKANGRHTSTMITTAKTWIESTKQTKDEKWQWPKSTIRRHDGESDDVKQRSMAEYSWSQEHAQNRRATKNRSDSKSRKCESRWRKKAESKHCYCLPEYAKTISRTVQRKIKERCRTTALSRNRPIESSESAWSAGWTNTDRATRTVADRSGRWR